MSWWVGGSLRTCSFLFFGLGAAAFRVHRARRGNVCLEDQAKAVSYTHLSTTAVSPFLYCFTMPWWVGGSLRTCSFLYFGPGAAAFRVDRARRGNVCLEDQAKACSPTDQPVRKIKDSSGINMTMKTFFTFRTV